MTQARHARVFRFGTFHVAGDDRAFEGGMLLEEVFS